MMNRIQLYLIVIAVFSTSTDYLQAQSPYELSMPEDGIILGIGLPLLYFGYRLDQAVHPINPEEIKNLKQTEINGFDRYATYQYSENAANLSDTFVYICLASPVALLFSQDIRKDAGTIYSMYGQSLIYGLSLPLLSKGMVPRFRPFVYNPEVPDHVKLTKDARKSFFSGHTSIAFTSMIFFASIFSGYYPESQWKPYVWTGSILLASSVGYLRVAAGKHYPTDVLLGALVGSLIGSIIPKIHESNTTSIAYPPANMSYKKTFLNVSFVF